MGLDTTHGCWHGGYHAFNAWRNKLTELGGYKLKDYGEGIIGADIDWDKFPEEVLRGKWKSTPDDPLLVLICHSDCDGSIYPKQARALADRIEALIPLLPQGEGPGHVRNWVQTTQSFVDGLRDAAKKRQVVQFH